jgi:ABC-type branched-subunit amino acid transport system ATPase component
LRDAFAKSTATLSGPRGLYAIDRGEIIFEGKPEQALEDANVMKALRG